MVSVFEEVVVLAFDRVNRRGFIAQSRDNQNARLWVDLNDLVQTRQAIHPRHGNIQGDHIVHFGPVQSHRVFSSRRLIHLRDFSRFEISFNCSSDYARVINDKEFPAMGISNRNSQN